MCNNLIGLTLHEKVFIVKAFYKLNEDVDSVSEAFKSEFVAETAPENVQFLIPQIVTLFEQTGSVLHDLYYETPLEGEEEVDALKDEELSLDGDTQVDNYDEGHLDEQEYEEEDHLREAMQDEDDEDTQVGQSTSRHHLSVIAGEEEVEGAESQVEESTMLDFEMEPPVEVLVKEGSSSAGRKKRKLTRGAADTKTKKRKPPQKKFCEKCQKFINHCFSEHMSTHAESRDFVCRVCSKTFTTIRYLKEHESTHFDAIYVCEVCGFASKTKSNHNSHMRVHGEKKYACEYCPLKFARAQGLRKHRMTHTGEKPYACKYCSQSFGQYMTRQMHERTHTGERPYKCPHCDKAFTGAPSLNTHLRQHDGEYLYQCGSCGKRYKSDHSLKFHMDKVHPTVKPEGT